METAPFFKICLQNELETRCEKNPRYSLRSFARSLGVDAAALSRFLSGKQIPTLKMAQKLFRILDLEPAEQMRFLQSLGNARRKEGFQRITPSLRKLSNGKLNGQSVFPELSVDAFRTMADWKYAAILELTFVEGFQSNASWIAKQLDITESEAKLAVERLIRLELLENANHQLRKTKERITTADKHLSTAAHRRFQKQILERAIASLDNDPIEERSASSMTMAIDPANLPLAKQMIEEFTHALCDALENGKQKRVYNFAANLYPVQKNSHKKPKESKCNT
jgi:uncharacterized protein (TIGR02147 family)